MDEIIHEENNNHTICLSSVILCYTLRKIYDADKVCSRNEKN